MDKKCIKSITDAEIYSTDKIAKVSKMLEEKINNSVYYNPATQQYAVVELVGNLIKLFVYMQVNGEIKINFIHLNNSKEMYTRHFEDKERITNNGFRQSINFNVNILLEDRNKIIKWLGWKENSYSTYYLLEEVPKVVSEKRREAREKKKMKKTNEMFSYLKKLPNSWQTFLDNQVMPERFGFFDHKKEIVYTTCCMSDISYTDFPKFKEKNIVVCPKCRKRLIMKSVNRKSPYINRTACLMDKTKDNKICMRYFDVGYTYSYNGIHKHCKEVVRTVWNNSSEVYYEPHRVLDGWKKYTPCDSSWGNKMGRHYEFCDESVLFLRNISSILKGTKYEKSGYELITGYNKKFYGYLLEAYLKGLEDKPYTEQLVKAGYQRIVLCIYLGVISCYDLNRDGTTPSQILKLNKSYLNEFKGKNVNLKTLRIYQIATEKKIYVDRAKANFIAKHFYNKKEDAIKYSLETLKKMHKYIENHVTTTYEYALIDYFDYLSLVNKLGYKEKRYRYPRDLKKAHDEFNELCKLQRKEENKRKFVERAEELKNFAFETKNYAFLVPKNPEDFVKESDVLHHCLARCYTDDYADGKTNIVFIRNKEDIEKPLATMEFFNGKIKQIRAVNNTTPEESVLDAVEKFKKRKFAVA